MKPQARCFSAAAETEAGSRGGSARHGVTLDNPRCGSHDVLDDGSGVRAATAPLPSDSERVSPISPETCGNCGGALPDGARFCPTCGAPVARDADAQPEAHDPGRRSIANIAFVLLLLLNVAVVAFAILVFGFGVFVED
jgi:hypothetical protein